MAKWGHLFDTAVPKSQVTCDGIELRGSRRGVVRALFFYGNWSHDAPFGVLCRENVEFGAHGLSHLRLRSMAGRFGRGAIRGVGGATVIGDRCFPGEDADSRGQPKVV